MYQETFQSPCTLFLDQASTAGWSVWDNNNTLIQSGIIERGTQSLQEHAETLIHDILELVEQFNITTVLYEEVFIPRDGNPGNVSGVENLYYIKHKITDLGYHNTVQVFGLDNGTWKKLLRNGKKVDKTVSDKQEILHYVTEYLPEQEFFTEDEVDSIGMGIAVMVNNNGAFYDVSRYNKKLPVHWGVSSLNFEAFQADNKLYARFKQAMDAGGLYEVPLDKSRKVEEDIKRVLTHKDVLAFAVIPKTYKYWGYYLAIHNILLSDLKTGVLPEYITKNGLSLSEQEDGTYILYASRKKRL